MKTREEIEAMSDEERRIKTAEFCGWKHYTSKSVLAAYHTQSFKMALEPGCDDWVECPVPDSFRDYISRPIPDYLNSLDAMMEAWLSEDGVVDEAVYAQAICEAHLGRKPCCHFDWVTSMLYATARQRNCAFLMTLLP